jgi:hypothetical protein
MNVKVIDLHVPTPAEPALATSWALAKFLKFFFWKFSDIVEKKKLKNITLCV